MLRTGAAPTPSGPLVPFLGAYRWAEPPGQDGSGTAGVRRHELVLTTVSSDGRSAIGSLVSFSFVRLDLAQEYASGSSASAPDGSPLAPS